MARVAWNRHPTARYGRLSLALPAFALGVLTLARARHDPSESFAGGSTLGAITELAAAWSLPAVGLVFWDRHRVNRCGPLLVAAGLAWLLPEWTSPGVGTAFGFTVGLIGAAAAAPLVGHAALAYPNGRLRSRLERLVVGVAYGGGIVLLGVLPTTVFDARAQGCLQCPGNLALVRGSASWYVTFEHYGLRIGIGWLAALALLLAWRLARAQATRLLAGPVVLPAVAYLALTLWDFEHSLGRDFFPDTDPFDVRTWRYEALALILLSLGVGWGLGRERRARGAVAKLVIELGRAPRPGALRNALAETLDDPTLDLAYRRANGAGWVNAAGMGVEPAPRPGQIVTPLLRGETQVAALVHDARLGDQPGLVEEVVSAARLALQNEQLQAEVRAQLEDLRASRARIVETADAERRQLERDLHDGAQQRIVALSLALQLLRSQLGSDPDPDQAARLTAAKTTLQQGLAELRELAHGIYPAVLSDEGLAGALETLAEQADVPIRLEALAEGRFPTAVEHAAYFTVVEAIRDAAGAQVWVKQEASRLIIRVRSSTNGEEPDRTELADRVGALDGRVTVDHGEVRVEIPCES
jgi:signal transduction histidine kinase